jgi:hypothetical protein
VVKKESTNGALAVNNELGKSGSSADIAESLQSTLTSLAPQATLHARINGSPSSEVQ